MTVYGLVTTSSNIAGVRSQRTLEVTNGARNLAMGGNKVKGEEYLPQWSKLKEFYQIYFLRIPAGLFFLTRQNNSLEMDCKCIIGHILM